MEKENKKNRQIKTVKKHLQILDLIQKKKTIKINFKESKYIKERKKTNCTRSEITVKNLDKKIKLNQSA